MQHLDCDCTYNEGVLCGIKNPERCEKCGWKPTVWERRKRALFVEKAESDESTDCRGPCGASQ